jgi:hypothetical protein
MRSFAWANFALRFFIDTGLELGFATLLAKLRHPNQIRLPRP